MTLASRVVGSLAKLPRATHGGVTVERDLAAKMTDGSVLLADRWYPTDPARESLPVVLIRTPYGRRRLGMTGRLFAERGYQVIIQSCRGTFGSGGEWTPFRNEHADGRDTLDWIESQPWFDGRLATFGPSYLGLTQWALAQEAPESLRAMALTETSSNFRDAVIFPSGCFALEGALTWIYQREYEEGDWLRRWRAGRARQKTLRAAFDVLPLSEADVAAVGHHVPYYQDWLEHEEPGDRWWDAIDFGPHAEDVPPSSLVGGWYDFFLPSQLDDHKALCAAGRSTSLTIGPWTHGSPGVIAASLRDGLEWFDERFDPAPAKSTRHVVRVFVMGERRWVELSQWPPEAEEQIWFLQAAGALSRSQPSDSAPDRYLYDPADPTPGIGGSSINQKNAGAKDQRTREARPDVLTYTSDVLTKDLTVIGPLSANLHVRSTLEHTDFFVRLCDVNRVGRSKNLSDGLVRLRPGDVPKAADGSFSIRISLLPTANTFKQGHRIRLQVSSGAHPLIVRNTGTGESLRSATHLRLADQEVFHDGEHPSSLVLPVSRF